MALVIVACLSGGWTIESCDENFNDPPVVFSGCDEDFCVAAGERCKYRLKNVRHRYFKGLPNGGLTEIYFGGTRTSWCWKGGSITKRNTRFPADWTSVVGSGSVTHDVVSSGCGTGNSQCLSRVTFHARLDAVVPGVGLPIGINEWFCVGTRIYAGRTRAISRTASAPAGLWLNPPR